MVSSSRLIHGSSKKLSSKRLFLITCNDDPAYGSREAELAARRRAGDLFDVDIDIELFAWETVRRPFIFEKFFKSIFAETGSDSSFSAARKFEEFERKLRRKEAKKRTVFQVKFKLHEDLEIAVNGYMTFFG